MILICTSLQVVIFAIGVLHSQPLKKYNIHIVCLSLGEDRSKEKHLY